MNKKIQSGRKIREEIAKVAIRLFLKNGVSNTSMRDLAQATGLTTGGLYYYFKSKDDIINLVVDLAAGSVGLWKEYYRGLASTTRIEAVKSRIKYWLQLGDNIQDYIIFYNRETLAIDRSRIAALMNSAREFIHFFSAFLEEGIKAGEFTEHDTKLVAFNVWSLHDEWALRRWLLRDYTIDQFIEKQTEYVLRQITHHAPFSI